MIAELVPYELRLKADPLWNRQEAGAYFDQDNSLFHTLRKITRLLSSHDEQYAIMGVVGLFLHGFRRLTTEIDITIRDTRTQNIYTQLTENGFVQESVILQTGVRDVVTGVKCTIYRSLDWAGPTALIGEHSVLTLPALFEFLLREGRVCKLQRQYADVQDAIKHLHLPRDYSNMLSPGHREKYEQLWSYAEMDRASERE